MHVSVYACAGAHVLFAFFRCSLFVVDLTLSCAEKHDPDRPHHPHICLTGERGERLLHRHSS